MLRCAELGLDTESLAGMTMGMVHDMLIERANDREEYPLRLEPGGMKQFFMGGGKIG